jgi:hypothetical protein
MFELLFQFMHGYGDSCDGGNGEEKERKEGENNSSLVVLFSVLGGDITGQPYCPSRGASDV